MTCSACGQPLDIFTVVEPNGDKTITYKHRDKYLEDGYWTSVHGVGHKPVLDKTDNFKLLYNLLDK